MGRQSSARRSRAYVQTMKLRTDLVKTKLRVHRGVQALYSRDKMERMRVEIESGSYTYLGRGYQHKAYLDPAAQRVVKVPRTVEEIIAPLALGLAFGIETEAQQKAGARKVIENTLNSYVPAITRGGRHIWPTDLVTGVKVNVGQTLLDVSIGVTQREFMPTETASTPKPIFDSGDSQEMAAFFDAYMGVLYTLTRRGLFVRDWINFENVIIIYQGGSTRLVLLDPFFNISTAYELKRLARNFEGFLGQELQQLDRQRFPYWQLFGERAIDFVRRFKIFDVFGIDTHLAERVPSSFDFEDAA